jgi:predicted transcriptional regulator
MADGYSEIDQEFVDNLYKAEDRGQGRFEQKGKTLFVAVAGSDARGIAVTTAKRGGAVKVAPLLADSADGTALLAEAIAQHYSRLGNRKLYALVPHHHQRAIRVLSEGGFSCEGLLREPYRRGVNMNVMSLFLNAGGDRPTPRPVLMSILPDPVERILNGSKVFELRKEVPTEPVQGLFLYTTGGTQAVQCWVEVSGYFKAETEELWGIVGEKACSRRRFEEYFHHYSVGYALCISKVCVFRESISLRELRKFDARFRVPIQFRYLDPKGEMWAKLDASRARGQVRDTGVEALIEPHRAKLQFFGAESWS